MFFGLFGKKGSSASVAKERLMVVLSYERKGLPNNFAELIYEDLVKMFSKYPQFNSQSIEVNLRKQNNKEELWISIPFDPNYEKSSKKS